MTRQQDEICLYCSIGRLADSLTRWLASDKASFIGAPPSNIHNLPRHCQLKQRASSMASCLSYRAHSPSISPISLKLAILSEPEALRPFARLYACRDGEIEEAKTRWAQFRTRALVVSIAPTAPMGAQIYFVRAIADANLSKAVWPVRDRFGRRRYSDPLGFASIGSFNLRSPIGSRCRR